MLSDRMHITHYYLYKVRQLGIIKLVYLCYDFCLWLYMRQHQTCSWNNDV